MLLSWTKRTRAVPESNCTISRAIREMYDPKGQGLAASTPVWHVLKRTEPKDITLRLDFQLDYAPGWTKMLWRGPRAKASLRVSRKKNGFDRPVEDPIFCVGVPGSGDRVNGEGGSE